MVRKAIDGLSRAPCGRPYSEGPSVNLGLELLSFLPPEFLDDLRREDDDPLDVLFIAEATTQLLLEFHTRMQSPRGTFTLGTKD